MASTRVLSRAGPRGFTLIELLCVMAILTMLAGLLFPVLAQVRERARQTTCISNLRQIGHAQLLYLQDWDDRFPHWNVASPPRPAPFGAFRFWTEYFLPYVRDERVFRDPSARWPWSLPAEEKLAEYALVTWGQGGYGTQAKPYWRWPGPPLAFPSVARPSETMTLVDGWTTPGWTGMDLRRHTGGMNAGFVDGHARWLPEAEFWRTDHNERQFYWLRYATADR
jgi:prepilin-type N-terminal cleavage/methylation domain-containing protein/prepilin-type processing-associated H-X9-DG protein